MVDNLSGVDIVVSYDHTLLELRRKRSFQEYDVSLDLDLIAKELFQPDEWWQSRELLRHFLSQFGAIYDFHPILDKNSIRYVN